MHYSLTSERFPSHRGLHLTGMYGIYTHVLPTTHRRHILSRDLRHIRFFSLWTRSRLAQQSGHLRHVRHHVRQQTLTYIKVTFNCFYADRNVSSAYPPRRLSSSSCTDVVDLISCSRRSWVYSWGRLSWAATGSGPCRTGWSASSPPCRRADMAFNTSPHHGIAFDSF